MDLACVGWCGLGWLGRIVGEGVIPFQHGHIPRSLRCRRPRGIVGTVKCLSTIVVAALSIGVLHAVQTERRLVTVGDGITVSVQEAGTGPPVIALHGGPGFRDYLAPDLEPLTSSFRVISYET